MSRFEELKNKGWANLNGPERAEYMRLKEDVQRDEDGFASGYDVVIPLVYVISDGNDRAIIRQYADNAGTITIEEAIQDLIPKMMQSDSRVALGAHLNSLQNAEAN